jgi:hypothetical protein
MFNLRNGIYLMDISSQEDGEFIGAFTLDELGPALYAACVNRGVNKVHLYGATDFLNGIVDDINRLSMENYSKTFIDIQIN